MSPEQKRRLSWCSFLVTFCLQINRYWMLELVHDSVSVVQGKVMERVKMGGYSRAMIGLKAVKSGGPNHLRTEGSVLPIYMLMA